MRTMLRLAAVIVSTSALAACGGGGDDPDAPVNPQIDGPPGSADARPDAPGPPDADPLTPDAMPGAFTCNGQPNPTTAPASVVIAGTTVELSLGGTTPVPNTTVDLFVAGNPTPVATTTSSGGTAAFTFNDVPTGGNAVDGYMRGTFPNATQKIVYVFPPQPIFQDIDNALVTTASNSILVGLNLIYVEPDQADTNGAVGVLVTDCLGNPLEGATVSTNPPGSQVLYRNAAGDPDMAATSTGPDGIGIIFNVPPGDTVTVDAAYQAFNMREHTIFVRPVAGATNSISTTIVIP
jgi:hypothetical protein